MNIENGRQKVAPGLSGIALFKAMPQFRRNTLQAFSDLTHRFGHVVRFKGLWTSFMLTHPSDIEHVLQSNAQNYTKGRSYRVLKSSTGNGLFVSEGDFWRRQRRLAQPAFHRGRIAGFAQTMSDAATEMVEAWTARAARNESVELTAELRRLTLRIVGQTLFSTDLSEETAAISRMLSVGQEHAIRRMFNVVNLPESFPTSSNRRYHKALSEGDRVIYSMIDERRRGEKSETNDLLAMLMRARDEETGEGMSDKQLRDEAFTIMVAGHETTVVALAWAFYLLSQHADVERKLLAELAAALDGRAPTYEDLPKLKYTSMIIQETLRLYPPAWALGRTTISDDEIGSYHIPAKAEIMLFPYITHRHPDFWDEPDEFDPERFAPERAESRSRYAYFPFGGGPRQCIGNNFALMKAQLILATVTQKFRLRPVPGQVIEPDASVTLRPRGGIRMNLQAA